MVNKEDKKKEELIQIKELAELSHVSGSVIRHWCDVGLLEGTYKHKPLREAKEMKEGGNKGITGKNFPRKYLKAPALARVMKIVKLKEKTALSLKEILEEIKKD